MKTCIDCGKDKVETDFYANKGCLEKVCKLCRREQRKGRYHADIDTSRAAGRERYWHGGMREYMAERFQRPEVKEAANISAAQYKKANPEKRKAHKAVHYAIKAGKLVRGKCSVCGTSERVEGHHDDYSKKLDVRWLCKTCHADEHRVHCSNTHEGPG